MKQPNRIKAAMREGRVARGFNLNFPSTHIIEILGRLDFDFVWIDGEHGPFSLEQVEEVCRAAELVGLTLIARVPNIHSSTILRFLDRGVQGVLGPHIASKADAEKLVKACYFGPLGERSFGGNRGCDYDFEIADKVAYYRQSNDNMLVGALLEDQGVIENLDEILSVEGIDYFGIGPNDFAQGLGFPGEPQRQEVVEAMQDVTARIRRAGRRVGSDIMRSVWVRDLLVDSARKFLAG
jgi:4-hydroxy-2-oxoheptanedioate aldolase